MQIRDEERQAPPVCVDFGRSSVQASPSMPLLDSSIARSGQRNLGLEESRYCSEFTVGTQVYHLWSRGVARNVTSFNALDHGWWYYRIAMHYKRTLCLRCYILRFGLVDTIHKISFFYQWMASQVSVAAPLMCIHSVHVLP